MTIRRWFLGWDAPLVERVADVLLAGADGPGALDLADTLVLVPTRQAGRRLQRLLSQRCRSRGGLLLPTIKTPAWLTDPQRHPGGGLASELVELAVWRQVLAAATAGEVPLLCRHGQVLGGGGAVVVAGLARLLAEGGLRMADVNRRLADEGDPAAAVWRELAHLETCFLQRCSELGLGDRVGAALALARQPQLPAGCRRLVLAAVADPMDLTLRAAANAGVEVVVLVHAPDRLAAGFDPWGRPLAAYWHRRPIPVADDQLRLAMDPAGQAEAVVAWLAHQDPPLAEVGLAVLDEEIRRPLVQRLAAGNVRAADVAGLAAPGQPLVRVLARLRDLLTEGNAACGLAFLRHPDVVRAVAGGGPVADCLAALDRLSVEHLPGRVEDLLHRCRQRPVLAGAADLLVLVLEAGKQQPAAALEGILTAVYRHHRLDPEDEGDRCFQEVAKRVAALLGEADTLAAMGYDLTGILDLILEYLGEQVVPRPPMAAEVELEGWLEAPWMTGGWLVVAGANQGRLPAALPANPFLPDSLAARLGLRHQDQQAGRDAFLLTALCHVRPADRFLVTLGKRTAKGDPLLPSRLLCRVPAAHLPARARLLFHQPAPRPRAAASPGFHLDLSGRPAPAPPEELAVSDLAAYLRCPFRYYLQRVLGSQRPAVDPGELDPLLFGTMLHQALAAMGRDTAWWRAPAKEQVKRFREWLAAEGRRRFGSRPPLAVVWQLEVMAGRLAAAARLQEAAASQGWEIVAVEQPVVLTVDGVRIQGRIDRIDRHSQTGAWRILDYKTGEKPRSPADVHLAPASRLAWATVRSGKHEKSWRDLQLPLYLAAFLADHPGAPVACGFWLLPRALDEAAVVLWPELDEALVGQARACAAAVVARIRANRFWPPATDVEDELNECLVADAATVFRLPAWLDTGPADMGEPPRNGPETPA